VVVVTLGSQRTTSTKEVAALADTLHHVRWAIAADECHEMKVDVALTVQCAHDVVPTVAADVGRVLNARLAIYRHLPYLCCFQGKPNTVGVVADVNWYAPAFKGLPSTPAALEVLVQTDTATGRFLRALQCATEPVDVADRHRVLDDRLTDRARLGVLGTYRLELVLDATCGVFGLPAVCLAVLARVVQQRKLVAVPAELVLRDYRDALASATAAAQQAAHEGGRLAAAVHALQAESLVLRQLHDGYLRYAVRVVRGMARAFSQSVRETGLVRALVPVPDDAAVDAVAVVRALTERFRVRRAHVVQLHAAVRADLLADGVRRAGRGRARGQRAL
jgi:hypothetical protein